MVMNKWDQIFSNNPQYKPLNEHFLNNLLTKIKADINPPLQKVVDLGCGTAQTLFQFSKLGFNVTGLDFSEVALNKVQQKIEENKITNIKLIKLDLSNEKINLEADIFLCNFVYTFINKKEFFLKNVAQCLRGDSTFILITPVTHSGTFYTEEDKVNIAVDFEETTKLLKNIFSNVEIYHHDYIGFREDYVTFLIKK